MVTTPTTRPSRTGRDPVTIELTAEEIASATAGGDPAAASGATGDAVSDASAAGPVESRETAAARPDLASSAAPESQPDLASPAGDAPGPEVGLSTGDASRPHSNSAGREPGPSIRTGFATAGTAATSDEHDASRSAASGSAPFGRAAPGASADTARADIAAVAPPARRAFRGTAFLAGLIGGLMVLVIAGALQFAGLLPSPGMTSAPAAVPEVVQAELAALRTDVAGLQQNAGTPAEDVQRLSAAVEEIRAELAALRDRPGGAAVDLTPLDARLTLLEKALAEMPRQDAQALTVLGERVAAVEALVKSSAEQSAAGAQALAASETRLAGLEQALSGLTAKVDAQASQPKIARAIAASALKAAIDRGAPFRAELETLAAIVPQSPELIALQAHAEKGVPTQAQILADMPAAVEAMIAADRPPDQNAGFFDRLLDSAQSMVEVRPIGAVPGAGVPETVARMEVAANGGDLAAALAEYETLPAPAKAAGADFAARMRARVEVIRLADQAIAAAMVAG